MHAARDAPPTAKMDPTGRAAEEVAAKLCAQVLDMLADALRAEGAQERMHRLLVPVVDSLVDALAESDVVRISRMVDPILGHFRWAIIGCTAAVGVIIMLLVVMLVLLMHVKVRISARGSERLV